MKKKKNTELTQQLAALQQQFEIMSKNLEESRHNISTLEAQLQQERQNIQQLKTNAMQQEEKLKQLTQTQQLSQASTVSETDKDSQISALQKALKEETEKISAEVQEWKNRYNLLAKSAPKIPTKRPAWIGKRPVPKQPSALSPTKPTSLPSLPIPKGDINLKRAPPKHKPPERPVINEPERPPSPENSELPFEQRKKIFERL